MAGSENLKTDPAFERWATMRETTDTHFRWNRRNIRLTLIFGVAVPLGVYALTSYTMGRFNFIGKRRGQSLLAKPESQ
ncbi:hypothetical protein THASP1DRAFT_31549 [Thamnocephalis sphaerospora]|uniref:NADH dehydrogenase [ubiquinone] 1 beta subcomplex subunit 4 n=1 Tax=Thamnocephalis sphaerospora TaxID=78915 RepID=A0A4P9XLF4_9FUNG|nr:hypothetical protein THASP1DRAFT_31549 [Thamnocephalis sphaerospora]|eukprot:RKP06645.1 hypothetical protein THASP1DRAFT_31549 [Thamnocephalis sphaerospora]